MHLERSLPNTLSLTSRPLPHRLLFRAATSNCSPSSRKAIPDKVDTKVMVVDDVLEETELKEQRAAEMIIDLLKYNSICKTSRFIDIPSPSQTDFGIP